MDHAQKRTRQRRLLKLLEANPLMNDEELAGSLSVSVSTVRLDRALLNVPELRERMREMAEKASGTLSGMKRGSLFGELLGLEPGQWGLSLFSPDSDMIATEDGTIGGHYLYTQAATLALASIKGGTGSIESARVRFLRPVFPLERCIARSKVGVHKNGRAVVSIRIRIMDEDIFIGRFIVVAASNAQNQREREGREVLIAVDAMGGDNAPHEVCQGAAIACKNFPDLEIALVGKEPLVREQLEGLDPGVCKRLHVVHADDVIGMEESPVVSIRKKKDSSLRVAMEMVHSKEAQGCVSCGNTGAIVAGGVLVIGRIPGIERPGLGMPLPALNRTSMLIDVGATVRAKPENLFQFALMGQIYMRHIFGVKEPEIALLSNGEEEIKGDEVVMAARDLIKAANLNFKGYVEGKDIPFGTADLVVCDGFTGNVLLKFMEGFGEAVYALLKEEMGNRLLPKMGMVFMLPMIKELWTRFDYERYGGTPLLGVNGAVIKAHGRSKSTAVANAIRVAHDFVEKRGVELIREELLEGGKL